MVLKLKLRTGFRVGVRVRVRVGVTGLVAAVGISVRSWVRFYVCEGPHKERSPRTSVCVCVCWCFHFSLFCSVLIF